MTFDAEVAETVGLAGKGPQECCVGLGAIGRGKRDAPCPGRNKNSRWPV